MTAKIIITGHSNGLGRALAEHYLAQGCGVLGISRSLLAERAGLQQQALNLSDSAALSGWLAGGAVENFIQGATEVILINNAGTVAPSAVCGRQNPAEIIMAVSLNVAAPLLLSNHLLSVRPETLPTKIIHISSGAGRGAQSGWSVYGATKAALDHHARCVKAENHSHLAIASIAPGIVDTGMQAEIRALPQDDFPSVGQFVQLKQHNVLSSPAAVAAAIANMAAAQDFGRTAVMDVR
ncbi:MAG: SDR family NAD(P)-dependent oxidoreductase [Neisseria sp.]|nr:SDR family NAD(P)-dependent oxidoreductase [Neisseria sp.]